MKKQIKKGMTAVLAGAMLLSLAACGSKDEAGKPVEIRIVTSERSKMDFYQKEADKFNSENDQNIQVVFDFKADNIEELIKTGYTSNNAPDIHTSMSGAMDELAIKDGWFREIPDDLRDEWIDTYGSSKVVYHGDKAYNLRTAQKGCPGYKLLWNKDLFKEAGLNPEEPPKTWDELREDAKKITEIGGGKKFGYVMPFKDAIFTRYYVIIPSAVSGFYNADGYDPVKGEYDFSVYAPLIEKYREIIADGSVFPSPYTTDNDTARAQFAEGNIGMICAAGWDVDVYSEQFVVNDDWGITEYPTMDGEVRGGYPYGVGVGTVYYMSASSKHPDEQLAVYKWFLSLQEDPAKKESKKGFKEFSEYKFPVAKSDAVDTPSNLLKLEQDDCWTMLKNLILSDEDVKEGLQQITDTYNAALQKAIDAGADINEYKVDADFSFYADNEDGLVKR